MMRESVTLQLLQEGCKVLGARKHIYSFRSTVYIYWNVADGNPFVGVCNINKMATPDVMRIGVLGMALFILELS